MNFKVWGPLVETKEVGDDRDGLRVPEFPQYYSGFHEPGRPSAENTCQSSTLSFSTANNGSQISDIMNLKHLTLGWGIRNQVSQSGVNLQATGPSCQTPLSNLAEFVASVVGWGWRVVGCETGCKVYVSVKEIW